MVQADLLRAGQVLEDLREGNVPDSPSSGGPKTESRGSWNAPRARRQPRGARSSGRRSRSP
eukprot:2605952-Alexandrium_andersonii.AAC.1